MSEQRFWAKVDKTGDCWLWTAYIHPKGYGRFRVGKQMVNAHRHAYEQAHGPIPEGLQIDHLCRNRACVNPAHLELVTCQENLLRGETINARHAAKTHCVNGHEFTEQNTYHYRGRRDCRECHRIAQKNRRQTKQQEARV